MQLSLRPYVTTGLAIAGASIIAVAPIQPTLSDIHVPNPAMQADVQLTGFIDETTNQLLFSLVATPTVRLSEALLVPLAEALGVDEETAANLPLASLGLVGPIISGGGATGFALQNLVDSLGEDNPLQAFITAFLVTGPAAIVDGIANGGFGPDLAPLVVPLLPALPPLIPVATVNFPPGCTPPACLVLTLTAVPSYGTGIFAPGLLTPLAAPVTTLITPPSVTIVNMMPVVVPGDLTITPSLPGTFPVLQQLLDQVFGLLNPPEEMTVLASTPDPEPVETLSVTNTDTSNQKLVTLNVLDQAAPELDTAPTPRAGALDAIDKVLSNTVAQASDALNNVKTKLSTSRGTAGPRLNVETVNPLDSDTATGDNGKSGSHRPDKGKVSVSDLTEKVKGGLGLGKGKNKNSDDGGDSAPAG